MATTDMLSPIGRRNLDNLKKMGCDAIEVDVNPVVRRKINKIALTIMGDISWPEHLTIFTIPMRIALQQGIKLIIWGENPEYEYGGPEEFSSSFFKKPRRWMEEFSGMQGMRVSDLAGKDGITNADLIQYTYPDVDALEEAGVIGLYIGMFFPWDGPTNAWIAKAYGFETPGKAVEGSCVDYQNLDNCQTGLHDYFMYLKYGFGRTTYHTCLQIRHGRITRGMGLDIVKRLDGKFPWTYLGKPIEEILEPMGMTVDEFVAICDKFTNKSLFKTNRHGDLERDRQGNLILLQHDNA